MSMSELDQDITTTIDSNGTSVRVVCSVEKFEVWVL
jgi:hypothetical protein